MKKTQRASRSSDESNPRPSAPAGRRLGWLLAILAAALVLLMVLSMRPQPAPLGVVDSGPADRPQVPLQLPVEPLRPSVDELHEQAEDVLTRLLDAYPDSPTALDTVATHRLKIRQYDAAAELWTRAIRLGPELAGPRAGLAEVEMQRGDYAAAVTILDEALAAGFHAPEIYRLSCQALQNTGDLERAEAVCRKALARYPKQVELWIELGRLQLQLQQLSEARTSLERALELEPSSAAAHYSLASVLNRMGDHDKAQQHEDRYEELKENHPLANEEFQVIFRGTLQKIVVGTLLRASLEYEKHGDFEQAEEHLLAALSLHPSEPEVYQNLVRLYRRQERLWDAHLLQQRLVDLDPTVENLVNLASLSAQLDRHQEAQAALQAALGLDPESALARRSLAMLHQFRGEFELARPHAEQLVRIHPDSQNYLLLSSILHQLGDRQAAQQAAAAARTAPNSSPRKAVPTSASDSLP